MPYARPRDGVLILGDDYEMPTVLAKNLGGEPSRCEIWAHSVSGGSHTPAVVPPHCVIAPGFYVFCAATLISFAQLLAVIVSQRIAVDKEMDTNMADDIEASAPAIVLDTIPLVEHDSAEA